MKMQRLFLAFQFLTIIPFSGTQRDLTEKDIGASSAFFPLVGLAQGFLLLLFFLTFGKLFPPDVLAGFLVVVLTLTNGGFHLEGLSDTFDAMASRKSKEQMLEIMKDGTAGPAGVTAIVLIVLMKYLLLKNVLAADTAGSGLAVLVFPVIGRWSMVPALFQSVSARNDGLGKLFIDHTDLPEFMISTVITALVMLLGLLFYPGLSFASLFLAKLLAFMAVVFVFCLLAMGLFQKKFGGLTGDNLGAISEISEILFLAGLVIVMG